MLYYKVKKQYDQEKRYKWNNHGQGVWDQTILVANELYTPEEYKRLANCPAWFDAVEIPKSKIYFLFGVRFEKKY